MTQKKVIRYLLYFNWSKRETGKKKYGKFCQKI